MQQAAEGRIRIDYVPLDEVVGWGERNPKKHDVDEIVASIRRHGVVEPPVEDGKTGKLVAGHGRVKALLALRDAGVSAPEGVVVEGGVWAVPVLRGKSFETEAEAEAYIIASNRLVEAGGWYDDKLNEMLGSLHDVDPALLAGTGYTSESYIAALVATETRKAEEEAGGRTASDIDQLLDEHDPEPPKVPVTQPGDMWQLGKHLIICGDCLDPAVIDQLLDGSQAKMCWTDPPWNVQIGKGADAMYKGKKKERSLINDDLGAEFPAFAQSFAETIAAALEPGGMCYLAMSCQEWPVVDGAMRAAGLHWSSTIIWVKDALILSQKDYHTKYEPIWYGWLGTAPRLYPLADRKQTDVWEIQRPKRSEEHPTMKPVELVARAIENSSKLGDVVFDPFLGSGTTVLAAEHLSRRAFGVEIDPGYCDVVVERWQTMTGGKAKRI